MMMEEEIMSDEEQKDRPRLVRCPADLQRLRLEKLMKNPDKPVTIPERPKERTFPTAPDFVRNVMGSSAGAGSGEFHVYRHLRRKEYARQRYIQEKSNREKLDDEYRQKIENNRKMEAEKTAKKRAKRLRKKQNSKSKDKKPKIEKSESEKDDESDESNDENEDRNNDENTVKHESDDKPNNDDAQTNVRDENNKDTPEINPDNETDDTNVDNNIVADVNNIPSEQTVENK